LFANGAGATGRGPHPAPGPARLARWPFV